MAFGHKELFFDLDADPGSELKLLSIAPVSVDLPINTKCSLSNSLKNTTCLFINLKKYGGALLKCVTKGEKKALDAAKQNQSNDEFPHVMEL